MFTSNARKVLEDCKIILNRFRDDAVYREHRFNWVLSLSLLRAVGHVLDKVDALESSQARVAIKKAWSEINDTKPEPKIFWRFLKPPAYLPCQGTRACPRSPV